MLERDASSPDSDKMDPIQDALDWLHNSGANIVDLDDVSGATAKKLGLRKSVRKPSVAGDKGQQDALDWINNKRAAGRYGRFITLLEQAGITRYTQFQ
jgi:hypothetical protein